MPAQGGGAPHNAPSYPAPKPAAPAPRQIGHMGVATRAPLTAKPPAQPFRDAGTGDYGRSAVNAYKATPAYHSAVKAVFKAQSLPQQAAIIKGLRANVHSEEAKAIGSALNDMPSAHQFALMQLLPKTTDVFSGAAKGLADIGKVLSPTNFLKAEGTTGTGSRSNGSLGLAGTVLPFAKGTSGAQAIHNLPKDIADFFPQAFTTTAMLGGQALKGQFGKVGSEVGGQLLHTFEHPVQSFVQHPFLTTLMVAGPEAGLSRLAAAPIRALAPESRLGRLVSTERQGVALTGNLTHERPPFSKAPTIKAGQALMDRALYKRAPTGELIPKSDFLHTRLLNQELGGIIGSNERIRVVNREIVRSDRTKDITPPKGKQVANAVQKSLAYGPHKALIPGANVMKLIADATIRRPDTIVEDLTKHLKEVASNRPNLEGDARAIKAHEATVKELQTALKNKWFIRNPDRAFAAAENFAKDWQKLEPQAHGLGHFPGMDKAALDRRAVMHYAHTHMGAEYDTELGLVRNATKDEVRSARQGLIMRANALEKRGSYKEAAALRSRSKQMWDKQVIPIPTNEVIDHILSEEGTGGRMPVYTADFPRFNAEKESRRAGFVSQARRPRPIKGAKNTLYAYTHGLTHIGPEALMEQQMRLRGIVDSHLAQNRLAEAIAIQKQGGGFHPTYAKAEAEGAPLGLVPFNLAEIHHPQASLDQAMEGVDTATYEEEALRHATDLSWRKQNVPGEGRWAMVDPHALKVVDAFNKQITPDIFRRTMRSLNNQFRTVALSTSPKHIPGVAQENLIRDIMNGVGFRSWVSGRRILKDQLRQNPERAGEIRTQLTGGQAAGMTMAQRTYMVSDHWNGTVIHPFLKAFEKSFKAPGLRQIKTVWDAWTHFAIGQTKKMLEEQHQIAGLGKAALREHGYAEAARVDGFMGLVKRGFGLHGKMLEDASKGLFDPAKARQMRSVINRLYGKWTDLSPGAQSALMFSPFGLWWVNSVKFLARMPVDQPMMSAALAAATAATQQQRMQMGLTMFGPNHLPFYEQGGIPSGNSIIAQNYYSPFGVANNPIETAGSLIAPWQESIIQGGGGVDYLWKPLTAPGQNTNRFNPHTPTMAQRAQYILDSALASFVPLYSKAEQVMAGGSTAYDVTANGGSPVPPLFSGEATKQPKKGLGAGLAKAFMPVRRYAKQTSKSGNYLMQGGSTSSGYLLGGGSSGGSSGYLLP